MIDFDDDGGDVDVQKISYQELDRQVDKQNELIAKYKELRNTMGELPKIPEAAPIEISEEVKNLQDEVGKKD